MFSKDEEFFLENCFFIETKGTILENLGYEISIAHPLNSSVLPDRFLTYINEVSHFADAFVHTYDSSLYEFSLLKIVIVTLNNSIFPAFTLFDTKESYFERLFRSVLKTFLYRHPDEGLKKFGVYYDNFSSDIRELGEEEYIEGLSKLNKVIIAFKKRVDEVEKRVIFFLYELESRNASNFFSALHGVSSTEILGFIPEIFTKGLQKKIKLFTGAESERV